MWIHTLYVNAATFLSLQRLLQKLCSRMSHWLDVGGSGIAFLFSWTKAQSSWEMVSGDVISIILILRDWGEGEGKICEASYYKKQKIKNLLSLMLPA